jgi:hypothetical protein
MISKAAAARRCGSRRSGKCPVNLCAGRLRALKLRSVSTRRCRCRHSDRHFSHMCDRSFPTVGCCHRAGIRSGLRDAAHSRLGLRPHPEALRARRLAAARPALVRSEIMARSFSASAAYRCSTKGSVCRPRAVTTNSTRCAIRPEMKCTSRERRSSFATITGARAALRAAASPGRCSSASEPLPVSASECQPASVKTSAFAKLSRGSLGCDPVRQRAGDRGRAALGPLRVTRRTS